MSLDPLVPAEEEGLGTHSSGTDEFGLSVAQPTCAPFSEMESEGWGPSFLLLCRSHIHDRREERPQSGVLDKGIRCLSPRELNFYLFRQPTAFLTVQLGFISHSKCSVPKRIYK